MIVAALVAAAAALTCGAATRPGVAERGADGVWRGRAVEACRAVAAAAAGPGAPFAFHAYDDPAALRAAADDRVAFLSPAELAVPALASAMRAGPVVTVGQQLLVVRAGARPRSGADLAGRLVCFIVGTRAEDALDAWAARGGVPVERLAFQEPDEMKDAFDAGKCAAAAVDAAEAWPGAVALRPVLDAVPVSAATPAGLGEGWAALVRGVLAEDRGRPAPR